MRVKSASEIDQAYKGGIGRAPANYQKGVQGTTGWKDAAIKGQALFEEKMRDPNTLARRAKGLQAVSDEEWKRNAVEKGAQRIGAGMTAGADKRTKNFEPYRAAMANLELPDRTSDPETNVTQRVGKIAVTLANLKKSM